MENTTLTWKWTVLLLAASVAIAPAANAQETRGLLKVAASSPPEVRSPADPYVEGLMRQANGDHKGAFAMFLEAAERGDAQAQRRLAAIYDNGNSVVRRDFLEAIRWYQMARAQGLDIPAPPRRGYGPLGLVK